MTKRGDALAWVMLLGLFVGCSQFHRSANHQLVTPKVDPASVRSESAAVVPPSPVESPIAQQSRIGEMAVESANYRWRDRPFSGGYFAGVIAGDPFHGGHAHTNDAVGLAISKRYGWDFADHWGLETKLADAWLYNSTRFNPNATQLERALFWDTSLLYYPWADTTFRPYLTLGAGLANFNVNDEHNRHISRVLADVPFGFGAKYPIKDWLIVRADLVDNLTIGGGGLPTMNNVVLMGGLEIRFGDIRKHFLPWLSGDELPSSPTEK